jgi:sugar transferase (PEP-CTERM/EpsH1 system associated)
MRVLYLCHRIPYPPNKGEKIRAFHQLKTMSQSCEIDLFTLADRAEDLQYKKALEPYCRTITVAKLSRPAASLRALVSVFSNMPLTLPYFYSAELARKVGQALSNRCYDRIFVYSSSMAQYIEGEHTIPILIDLVDVDSDKWQQYSARTTFPRSVVFQREANCLAEYERHISEKARYVLVTSEREARVLRQITSSAKVRVIPNGVDHEYFAPSGEQTIAAQPTIIFTGAMDYFPNADAVEFFARHIFPLIRAAVPNARFLIVGSRPSRTVERLAKLPGIQVTGWVPDVRPYLLQSQVFVAPLLIASGTQNKVLEAMAVGLPVIATRRAIQGIGENLVAPVQVVDSTHAWAAKVVQLLRDRSLAKSLGEAGRRKIVEECSWEKHLSALMDLVHNLEAPEERDLDVSLVHRLPSQRARWGAN